MRLQFQCQLAAVSREVDEAPSQTLLCFAVSHVVSSFEMTQCWVVHGYPGENAQSPFARATGLQDGGWGVVMNSSIQLSSASLSRRMGNQ